MQERSQVPEQGQLPRSREAVDWWLKRWGRQAVVDGKEPLTREDVERLIEVNGGIAEGLFLRRRDMRRINLWGGLDSEHDVQPFQFQDVDLSWSNLQEADLSWADLESARLIRSVLQGADLLRANLRKAYLREANLQRAYLQDVNLQDANLETANLQSGMLVDANLQRANLREANLQGANLSRSDMRGADLRGADLRHAYLAKVQISSETNLERVKWDSKFINGPERNGDYETASLSTGNSRSGMTGLECVTSPDNFIIGSGKELEKPNGRV